jgi:hypothetical protein
MSICSVNFLADNIPLSKVDGEDLIIENKFVLSTPLEGYSHWEISHVTPFWEDNYYCRNHIIELDPDSMILSTEIDKAKIVLCRKQKYSQSDKAKIEKLVEDDLSLVKGKELFCVGHDFVFDHPFETIFVDGKQWEDLEFDFQAPFGCLDFEYARLSILYYYSVIFANGDLYR